MLWFIQYYFMAQKSGPSKQMTWRNWKPLRCVAIGKSWTSVGKIRSGMKRSFPEFLPANLNRRAFWLVSPSLNWPGLDMCRMNNMRHPKHILMETVPGTNRQGRPRKRWEDDITATGTTFHLAYRSAQDRYTWAEFVRGANVLRDMVYR